MRLIVERAAPPRPYRRLRCDRQLKRLMKGYYALCKHSGRLGLKTAWLTSGAPVEIPLALGIIPQYPENYGALCGARRLGAALCGVAEARGYSADICSYARNGLGSVFEPGRAPLGGLSRPDALIACNNLCSTLTKWWEHLAHYLDVPLFILDIPFSAEGRPTHLLRYAERQLWDLVAFLERVTDRRLRPGALARVLARSAETVKLWSECLDLCTARPSPLGCADRFLTMAPVVTFRGTRSALRFYRGMKREVADRVASGRGAVRRERRRLLWDNIAIWHDIHSIFNRFAAAGVAFPVDTYTSAWTRSPSASGPMRGMAEAYSSIYLNVGMQEKIDIMARMIRRFELDGFVLHSNRSCKPYSLGQYVIKQELLRITGRPGLILEADMVDERYYDRHRVAAQIDAFLEVL